MTQKNWSEYNLGDMINLKRGYDLPSKDRIEGIYPIISSSGVSGTHCIAKVKGPGVITGRYGTLGQVFYLINDYWPLNTSLYVQDFKGNHPRYISFLLKTLDFEKLSGASAVPGINRNDLHKIKVRIPNNATQRKIAAILSAYDDLIENNLRRIKILEEMAQNLYCEWFVKFRFPGHEHARFVDSPLGQIPEEWEVEALESLISEHIGGGWGNDTYDNDHTESAWVIRGTDIPEGRYNNFLKVPQRYHTKSNLKSRRLMSGDIVFEVSGGSKGQPVGRALYMSSAHIGSFMSTPVICASFCKRIKPNKDRYASEILYLSFVDAYTSGEIEQYQVQSTGITNFKWTEYIAKVNRCIPPKSIQNEFHNFCGPVLSTIATLGRENNILRHTRDLLLPKLISGEIDVSELDITVPEEVHT